VSALMHLLQGRAEYLIKWKGWGHKYVIVILVLEVIQF